MTENEQPKELAAKPSQIGIKVLIINPRGEVLLLKRNPEAYGDSQNYWDIPGGRVENDRDIATVINGGTIHSELTRELREEIGWTPEENSAISFVAHQQVETSDKNTVDRYTVALRVNEDIHIRLSPEHTDYKWVPADALKSTPDIGSALKALVHEHAISR